MAGRTSWPGRECFGVAQAVLGGAPRRAVEPGREQDDRGGHEEQAEAKRIELADADDVGEAGGGIPSTKMTSRMT